MPILAINVSGTYLGCRFYSEKSEEERKESLVMTNPAQDLKKVLRKVGGLGDVEYIAFKVNFGGDKYSLPKEVSLELITSLKLLYKEYGISKQIDLDLLGLLYGYLPNIKIIVFFDTAFFTAIDEAKRITFIPIEWAKVVSHRKFGAHGLMHEAVLSSSIKRLKKDEKEINIVSCYLGDSPNVVSVKNGLPFDSSSGIGLLNDLPGLKSIGKINHHVIFSYLTNFFDNQKKDKYTKEELVTLINQLRRELEENAGIIGFSGADSLKTFLENKKSDPRLEKIEEAFVETIIHDIASNIFLLGRIDALCFSGPWLSDYPDLKNMIQKKIKKIVKVKITTFDLDEDRVLAERASHYLAEKKSLPVYELKSE